MTDMSRISTARTALHTALTGALEASPWRVWRTPPTNIAAPCIYIGSHQSETVEPRMVLSFPVVAVVDGTDARQVEQADDMAAIISDAIFRAGGIPRRTTATRLDVGGPTLRAVETTAEFSVASLTLCLPILEGVAP